MKIRKKKTQENKENLHLNNKVLIEKVLVKLCLCLTYVLRFSDGDLASYFTLIVRYEENYVITTVPIARSKMTCYF